MKALKKLAVMFLISPLAATAQSDGYPQPVDPVTNCELRYYFYPNLEAYYDARKDRFLLQQKGEWIVTAEIPSGYRGYSLFNKINVVINDYEDDNVTQFLEDHKKRFPVRYAARQREVASASAGTR